VLIHLLETALWGENCWLVAAGPGAPAVAIDPGLGAAAAIDRLCQQQGLELVGVLASHGHLDHVADAARLADRWRAPLWIHPADRGLLTDPAAGLDQSLQGLAEQLGGGGWHEPRQVEELADGQVVELAGLSFTVLHAPGHRPGCVIFRLPAEAKTLAFTGDVLFAGSIGRTDLPGGSMPEMRQSLRHVVLGADAQGRLHLPDDVVVLPGHGPQTTMAQERAFNPYLQTGFLEAEV